MCDEFVDEIVVNVGVDDELFGGDVGLVVVLYLVGDGGVDCGV